MTGTRRSIIAFVCALAVAAVTTAAASTATATTAAATAAASKAAVTGGNWRVAATIYPAKGSRVFLSSVAAPGADDVWALGGTITNSDQSFPVLEHWNGRTWKSVALPGSFAGFPFEPYQVAASSAADVWVFTSSGEPKAGPLVGRWAHWNGDSWTTGAFPVIKVAGNNSPSVTITAAAAAGQDDVWVGDTVADWDTQSGLPAQAFLANDDGHGWQVYRLPETLVDLAGISVVSRTDIWAAASSVPGASGVTVGSAQPSELLHWNGASWQSIQAPKGVAADAVLGVSARSAWVTGEVSGQGPDHVTWIAGAAYWNGARWTIVPDVAADANFLQSGYIYQLTSVAPDGQGGLWAVAEAYQPIVGSLPGAASLWHYTNGRWTGTSLGSLGDPSLFQLVTAPGTRDIWAAGTDAGRSSAGGYPLDGTVLQYGN
jgi:hypothetical protein